MEELFITNQKELLWTLTAILVLLLLKFVTNKSIKRIGRISNLFEGRILLITRYASILLSFLGIIVISVIWSVDYQELGLLFSSVFAIAGVALFASWSILSNITAGVILFFFFPFKIGDRIKIMDKEISETSDEKHEIFRIENIKAFHVHLRNVKGQLLTYPNNMMLQKGVTLIETPYKSDGDQDSL